MYEITYDFAHNGKEKSHVVTTDNWEMVKKQLAMIENRMGNDDNEVHEFSVKVQCPTP